MTTATHEQFQVLLEHHRKIVFKVANTYSHQREDRDDLAQEIIVQLWRAFPAYDNTRTFSTWMYRIALNVAITFLRNHQQHQRHTEALVDGHSELVGQADVSAESDQRVLALQRLIAKFDPLNRALLLLYLEEHSYREIAEVLGISETNVATKIGRLKQTIRQKLAPETSNAKESN